MLWNEGIQSVEEKRSIFNSVNRESRTCWLVGMEEKKEEGGRGGKREGAKTFFFLDSQHQAPAGEEKKIPLLSLFPLRRAFSTKRGKELSFIFGELEREKKEKWKKSNGRIGCSFIFHSLLTGEGKGRGRKKNESISVSRTGKINLSANTTVYS